MDDDIVVTAVHSPYPFKAIGPLANLPQFADAFRCSVGSTVNPLEKIDLW